MAIQRQIKKCPKCGEPYRAIYKNESNFPMQLKTIGDTFIRWDFEGHKCKSNYDLPDYKIKTF